MTEHAVVVAGGGPTGLMLAGELAVAGGDVAIVERRPDQERAGSRAGSLHARALEVFDQRGIADRFLSAGQAMQVAGFSFIPLDIRYDLGEGRPLLGRRMPDLDLVTAQGPLRVFSLLHDAQPVLLNFGAPDAFDIAPWVDRVRLIDAGYDGKWELPVLGPVTAPSAVLIRPDGYVARVGDLTQQGLTDALAIWFGPPTLS